MNRALWMTTAFLIGQTAGQPYLEPAPPEDPATEMDEVSTDLSSGAALDASGPEVRLDPQAAPAAEARLDDRVLPEEQGIGGAGGVEGQPEVGAENGEEQAVAQPEVGAENGDEVPPTEEQAGATFPTAEDGAEDSAATVRQLNARLRQLEARMAELEVQGTTAQAEVAALQEEAARLQESASAPGEAADQQRESRALRVRTLENAMAFVVQAYEIVETGEDDVSETIGSAHAALEEGRGLAEHAGSPLEAQRFEAAMRALSEVPAALTERDFQRAKELLAMTLAECNQARLLAQASSTLPVTAR